MKKTLLSLIAIAGLSMSLSAQIEIYVDAGTVNMSGEVENYALTGAVSDHHMVDFIYANLSENDETWTITRRVMSQPASWSNYFCWGQNGQFGNCYDTSYLEYFNSGSLVISSQTEGLVSTYVNAPDAGTAVYRYYVSNDGGTTFLDSIDLMVSSTADVPVITAEQLSVKVAPNPATEYILVSTTGASSATVRIIDILGNQILKSTISESKTIDVSEYRNGIYFVIVESKGTTINRKVIVRH